MADRLVMVTGAASGIGAACALAFGGEGAKVAVLYFADADAAEHTATGIRQAGGEAITVQAHVDDEASVDAAFSGLKDTGARPTCWSISPDST